jgi:hypothetical protein
MEIADREGRTAVGATEPSRGTRLLDIVHVDGRSLAKWLDAAGQILPATVGSELARDWLQAWSVDIQILGDDHELRNTVSYRPQRIRTKDSMIPFGESLAHVLDAWNVCQPVPPDKFALLDQYLLRHALSVAYTRRTGSAAQGSGYKKFVDSVLANLGLSDRQALRTFLFKNVSARQHPLLQSARRKGRDARGVVHPLPVMARSLLVLRLASAAVSDFLRESGIHVSHLSFWWEQYGEEIGLWLPGSIPLRIDELWNPIEAVMQDLSVTGVPFDDCSSQLDLQERLDKSLGIPIDLEALRQFQRAGFWALVP